MGMSASQARFLSLTARKTNVEYEGQQINQQRTTLSNESSNYYSQLTSMSVPVPPSTADYTKVTYTFTDGNAKNTITSLVATRNTAKSGLYMLNYVQEIPSHNMVVNGTSIVTKTGDKYNIGTVELQQAGSDDSIEKFTKAGIPYEIVVSMSADERANKLKVEQQYVAMASEKYANENWLVRYQKNSATGSYEAVLYSLKELQNANYNAVTGASLSGLKQYVFGETTESREIKNVQAKLTQDATGRYQTITLFNDDEIAVTTVQGDTRTPSQISTSDAWRAREPRLSDYVDSYSSPVLYDQYSVATRGCHIRALDGDSKCYKHVLAHMLGLSLNLDNTINESAYPKYFESSISNGISDVKINYDDVRRTAIHDTNQTPNMLAISNAVNDGYQPEGKTKNYTILASPYTNTSTETGRLMSYYYLRQGNATDTQKLLSNYYVDSNGNIMNKTLKQKCIDLAKAIELYNSGNLDISNYNVLSSILVSIDDDIKTFTLNDQEGYDSAVARWQSMKPANSEPVIGDISTYSVNGVGTTYTLTTTTESDDAAYNQAMNQYYYDKAQYDQMVQNVNAKIQIIQVQDKNLELKLKQLDTEQNAIQTEMDAVKKVISKNVESSFKTFNA